MIVTFVLKINKDHDEHEDDKRKRHLIMTAMLEEVLISAFYKDK